MIAPPPGTSAGHHVGPPQGSGTNSHQVSNVKKLFVLNL
jgi:hypothetical protein